MPNTPTIKKYAAYTGSQIKKIWELHNSTIFWIILTTILLTGLLYFLNFYVFPIRDKEGVILYGEIFRNFVYITLVLWTLTVIVVQAFIYEQQRQAMQEGIIQSARQAGAAEISANTAKDAFRIGEAPYFGISQIRWVDEGTGSDARLEIHFLNGGKTPAWHFHSVVWMTVSGENRVTDTYDFLMMSGNMRYSFVPASEVVSPVFKSISFEKLADVYQFFAANPKADLVLTIIAVYQDFTGEWQDRTFEAKGGRGAGEDFVDVTADEQREEYEKNVKARAAEFKKLTESIRLTLKRPAPIYTRPTKQRRNRN